MCFFSQSSRATDWAAIQEIAEFIEKNLVKDYFVKIEINELLIFIKSNFENFDDLVKYGSKVKFLEYYFGLEIRDRFVLIPPRQKDDLVCCWLFVVLQVLRNARKFLLLC